MTVSTISSSVPRNRIELLSTQLKRSLLVSLQPYSGGLELTVALWASAHALAKASAYIANDKGLRLRRVPDALQEDFGDFTLAVGRTTFSVMESEIQRLVAFFAANSVEIETTT